jgi:hypothetical protein
MPLLWLLVLLESHKADNFRPQQLSYGFYHAASGVAHGAAVAKNNHHARLSVKNPFEKTALWRTIE